MYSYTECLSYLLYVVIVYLQSDFPRPKCYSLTYTSSVTTVAQRTRPTFGRQNHGQRDSSLLFSSLNNCLPKPPLPFTSSVPQENVFHCSFMLLSLCPCPSFFVSLKTFSASFKIHHKCISMKHSPVPPGKAAGSLSLFMGRAFHMLEFMHLKHSVAYWRYLSILLAWK